MIEHMIERPPHLSGVSLVEAVLARWLVELSGRQYFIDEFRPHRRSEPSALTAPDVTPSLDTDSAPERQPSVDDDSAGGERLEDPELEVDDRFPGLARFAGLLEDGAGHLAAARAAHREQCRQAALQVRALAAFAAARPAAVLDRPDHEVGAAAAASRAARPGALTAVSEWAVDEVMVALGLSAQQASGLLADSITLHERLPATVDALEAGRIGWPHARMLAEVVGPVKDEARAGVEARLLARAAGKTVSQLREAARRAVLRADAAAATQGLARALRERGVRLHPGKDGMASLAAVMTLPVAQACRTALAAYAADCATPGDARTLDQRMADCLADLILRPGINPPVQIGLTLVAGVDTLAGGDEPGEVDGHPVPAELARELAHALGLLARPEAAHEPAELEPAAAPAEPADPETEPAEPESQAAKPETEPAESEPRAAEPGVERGDGADPTDAEPGTESARTARPDRASATAALADLLNLRSVAGTPLTHLPRIAIVDELSGQLLALTDAAGIRRAARCAHPACRTGQKPCTHPPAGTGLGPPPATDRYRPTDPLDRFARARDRRCRFPGCRAAAIRCDLHHATRWPDGPTSEANLCCLCRHHHRLIHQAPGWTLTVLPDGGLRWTTPGGQTLTTHPPRYGTDDDLPPPAAPPEEPDPATEKKPIGLLQQLRRWPPPPPDPDDEPAPF